MTAFGPVDLGLLKLRNPLLVASGTFGVGDKHPELYKHAGAFVSKTVTLEPRVGNPPTRIVETPSGIVNYVGLQNPGIDDFVAKLKTFEVATTFICSVNATSVESVEAMIGKLESHEQIAGYELNLSCPNIKTHSVLPSIDKERIGSIVVAARSATKKWICAKLPPYGGIEAGPICESRGADALCVSNTYPSIAFTPKGERIMGGLSGPAIKPMVLYNVFHTAARVEIPIIASGGICNGEDLRQMLEVGATAVQIGSIQFVDPNAVERILRELEELG